MDSLLLVLIGVIAFIAVSVALLHFVAAKARAERDAEMERDALDEVRQQAEVERVVESEVRRRKDKALRAAIRRERGPNV